MHVFAHTFYQINQLHHDRQAHSLTQSWHLSAQYLTLAHFRIIIAVYFFGPWHRNKCCESELIEENTTSVLSHANEAKSSLHCILKSISKLAEPYCETECHHLLHQAEGTVGRVSTSFIACVHCWLSFSMLQPASKDGSLPSKAASWSHVSCAQAMSRLLLPAQHTAHKASAEPRIYSKHHQQPHVRCSIFLCRCYGQECCVC